MKSRMKNWTGLSLALIFLAMLAEKIWPVHLLGLGGAALACCYDPPAAVIVPDPPATPAPDAAGETQIMVTADTSDSPSEAQEEREDAPLPFNLLDEPVTAARNAIEDGEWLQARAIILDAEDVFGGEPILVALRAEINAFFGLTDMRAPTAASTDFPSPPSQTLSADTDPLATMLMDFGAMSSSAAAE